MKLPIWKICAAYSSDMRTCRDCSEPKDRACFKPVKEE